MIRALLALLRGDRPWYLPSIALGEYRYGLLSSTHREQSEEWLDRVESACIVVTPDGETARRYAAIRQSLRVRNQSIPYHDIWIAALAEQHSLEIVSRDTHFDLIPGLRRLGW
jgi:predicted nucleic acid-binding protein